VVVSTSLLVLLVEVSFLFPPVDPMGVDVHLALWAMVVLFLSFRQKVQL